MNKNAQEALDFVKSVDANCAKLKCDAGIAVPFIYLADLVKISKNIIIAAQNCYYESKGAYTGEISVDMLKSINIKYVIIGHSERRGIFHETDEMVNLKNKTILAKGLIPIICCGETLEQYEKKATLKVVNRQIEIAFKDISADLAKKAIIAYEPIWAIGTGKTATPEIAQNVCKKIREKLAKLYNDELANTVRIQYGGSVNAANVADLLKQDDIDGALVGGASLEGNSFMQLVK